MAAMWVRSLPFQPQLTGRYDRLEGREANAQPVWRQAGGPGWIYSSTEGVWFVTVHEHCVGKTGGIIGGLKEHGGAPPQDMAEWKRWGGPVAGWLPDEAVALTASQEQGEQWEAEKAKAMEGRHAQAPQALALQAPAASPELAGRYVLAAGRSFNAQPLWKQEAGPCWLYADSFGFWRFTDNETKMEEGGSFIQSSDLAAPSLWPQEVTEWKRDGGGCGCDGGEKPAEWVLDPDIAVTA
mmetsp:Transcript_23312/g.73393  ORF Transcript_23312/g.73393 Transcript_23312/m.73393 type:complete len:239 (+) Transcript_23312:646-1362(+)